MVYAVSEVARKISYSPSQVRNLSKQFADYLSQAANPPAGEARAFDDHDLSILATVAQLRSQKQNYDAIRAALAAGDLVDLPPEASESRQEQQTESAMVTRLTATVARFEGELDATKTALHDTKEQLSEERTARLAAEIRATAAETELKVLRDIVDREKPTEEPEKEESRSFWRRLFGG